MDKKSLLDRCLEELDGDPRTLRDIAAAATVDYEWLAKLKQRRISEPGIRKIERLYGALTDARTSKAA